MKRFLPYLGFLLLLFCPTLILAEVYPSASGSAMGYRS